MKIVADTHTHTVASTHAYSTLEEMVNAAAKKGLYAIAITDHGKTMPGAPGIWYFENLRVVPEVINGVKVLKGIETNVIDYNGNFDTDNTVLSSLEWVVASMHEITLKPNFDQDFCTEAWLNVCKNPYVSVIGHSGVDAFKFDYEKVIPEFGRNGKLVEINNSSFKVRKTACENCKKIAEICKKNDVPIIVNSDAHFSYQVGVVDEALELLKEINFPEELIINADIDRFKGYLEEYKARKGTTLV